MKVNVFICKVLICLGYIVHEEFLLQVLWMCELLCMFVNVGECECLQRGYVFKCVVELEGVHVSR